MKIDRIALILELTTKLEEIFGPDASKKLKIDHKADWSQVTEIDHFVSLKLKEMLKAIPQYAHYHFFSEEDYGDYQFPCAIVDPIDGTRELVKGRAECAVALALMNSPQIDDPLNEAWIYNPFSGFSVETGLPYVRALNKSTQKYLSFVSRTEYHQGLYREFMNHPLIDLTPRGSIAFKLGLLASGACDFIISLADKNVWDIAAGTILCFQRGFSFYENGIKISTLDRPLYTGKLIWAPAEIAPMIHQIFNIEFRFEK